MKPIVFIIAAIALASPSAWASTELSTGTAVPIAFSEPSSPNGRDNSSWLAPGSQTEPSLSEESAADDDAFTVSDALLKVKPAAPNRTPSSWVILLIAFAGLTAFFTGKRSGGRGLIFV
jgi:hypothetical protein